jgi:hypothetical protein
VTENSLPWGEGFPLEFNQTQFNPNSSSKFTLDSYKEKIQCTSYHMNIHTDVNFMLFIHTRVVGCVV